MKRRRYEDLSVDLTPLIDCTFLLLAFFLVSTAFRSQDMALLLNLPKSEVSGVRDMKNEIMIELSDTEVAFNGKKTDLENLAPLLDTVSDTSTPVSIRIDETVPYRRVVRLLDLLQERGMSELAFMKQWEAGPR